MRTFSIQIKGLLLCAVLFVAGCKEVLYSGLTEVEANEMVAILQASGIEASRSADKDGIYALLIEESNVGPATMILKSEGYPKKKFKNIGDIFDAEGIVGTPFEERVRYMYAMNEKLAEHLTSISGIRDARVAVNIPERSRFDQTTEPSKASVILHFEESFLAQSSVPKIKTLVANSVQGLEYDNVAVVMFAAGGAKVTRLPNDFSLNAAEATPNAIKQSLVISNAATLETWAGPALLGFVLLLVASAGLRTLFRKIGLRWS